MADKEIVFHELKSVTDKDWDALDPNSYETTCAACDTYILGQFDKDNRPTTPCPKCGSTETKGGISSPAGGASLLMRMDF